MKRLVSGLLSFALAFGPVCVEAAPLVRTTIKTATQIKVGRVAGTTLIRPLVLAPLTSSLLGTGPLLKSGGIAAPAPAVVIHTALPATPVPVFDISAPQTNAATKNPVLTDLTRITGAKDIAGQSDARFDGTGAFGQKNLSPVPTTPSGDNRTHLQRSTRKERSSATPPRAPPKHPRRSPKKPSRFGFKSGVALGITAAAAGLYFLAANPIHHTIFTAWAASTSALIIWLAFEFIKNRRARSRGPLSIKNPPPRMKTPAQKGWIRRKAPIGLGIVLGLMLGTAPAVFTEEIVEATTIVMSKSPTQGLGSAFRSDVESILSENEAGREVLENYRDIFGIVRLPNFSVEEQEGSNATHQSWMNAIDIDSDLLTSVGVTYKQLREDPEARKRFIRDIAPTLIHELRHGEQARRSITAPDMWAPHNSLEEEYEAFITAQLYIHEVLKADPHAKINSRYDNRYKKFIGGFDEFLVMIDGFKSYKNNVHHDEKDYPVIVDMRKHWAAISVEGYINLAKRSLPTQKWKARAYLIQAKDRAITYGLPVPSLNIPR